MWHFLYINIFYTNKVIDKIFDGPLNVSSRMVEREARHLTLGHTTGAGPQVTGLE